MSLSTWVQLLRNAFCVLKSLLPASNFFQHPYFTDSSFYPLTVTTAIELPIALTQFAAVIFNVSSGWSNIGGGRADATLVTQWLKAIDRVFLEDSFRSSGAEYLIIKQGLESDRKKSRQRASIGVLELIFGVAFLFLVLNSLHITGPSHPKPLIDALISMEMGLAYILILMWGAFTAKVRDTGRLAKLSALLSSLKAPTTSTLLLATLQAGFKTEELFDALLILDDSYSPLWRKTHTACVGDVCAVKPSLSAEIQTEFKNITAALSKLTAPDVGKQTSVRTSVSLKLRRQEYEARLQAPLEFLYFLLNFTAGYGYLLGILAFYIPEVGGTPLGAVDLIQSVVNGTGGEYSWCKVLMFGMTHSDADWWGNLAGDVAWTIEPIVILLNKPFIKLLADIEFSMDSLDSTVKKPKAE